MPLKIFKEELWYIVIIPVGVCVCVGMRHQRVYATSIR